MTAQQRLALEQSRIRERLNALLGKDELSAEERSELDTLTERAQQVEVELRAAIVAEPDPQPELETRDGLGELEKRARMSRIVEGVFSGKGTDGAERELQDELGIAGDHVPLALLASERREVELRTSGQTPAPTKTGASQQPIIPAVFPRAAATFLGVEQPRVPTGDATFTVLSTNLAPGTPAAGANQAHSAAAFTATVVDPERIQGSFFIRREDRARLMGMEQALRENLSDAISDKMDAEIIANGFLASSGGVKPANSGVVSSASDFADYLSLLYSQVDGTYAHMASDVRLLCASDAYGDMGATYRGNNADYNAVDALLRQGGGLRVSAHIPAAATVNSQTNQSQVIAAKGVGRRHAVAPIWEGVQIIVDEVTQAKAGEIVFTAVMLWGGFHLLRSDAFDGTYVKLS